MKAMSHGEVPSEFLEILSSLRSARLSPVIHLTEVPGPARLAPYTAAISASVFLPGNDEESARGRLVLLYDPQGQESWHGRCRIVIMVRADLEPDICADPLIHEVTWSWLTEALRDNGRTPIALAGTVTRTLSNSFGEIREREDESAVELRASWTAADTDVSADIEAWGSVLGQIVGLPPLPEGVTALHMRT